MINWDELKFEYWTLVRVDSDDIIALSLLYENSIRMGGYIDPSNSPRSNVEMATHHPSGWFDEIKYDILENVSFVSKSVTFIMTSIVGEEIFNQSFSCDDIDLEDIESVKDLLNKGKFSNLILFSIVKYVDLNKLKVMWRVKYKLIEDKVTSRDKKIDNILE